MYGASVIWSKLENDTHLDQSHFWHFLYTNKEKKIAIMLFNSMFSTQLFIIS